MIIHSQRAGLIILEYCKIMVSDGRVAYSKADEGLELFYSIPYANISVLLLGSGTSITNEAARMLGEEGTLVGFTGGGGAPFFMGSMSEYRPTEYAQRMYKIWSDETLRLRKAVELQKLRVSFTNSTLSNCASIEKITKLGNQYLQEIEFAKNQESVLLSEGRYIKSLYACLSTEAGIKFVRDHRGGDATNKRVTNANYYGYALAATVLWALGIPPSLALLHGKTRRGALVFDLADVIKCGSLLNTALTSSSKGSEFKRELAKNIDETKALKFLFQSMKTVLESD